MKKLMISTLAISAALAFGTLSHACDMHGAGGFSGFGMSSAPWQSYSPQASTQDPAFTQTASTNRAPIKAVKAKPNFSNVANVAAAKAKARLAKKRSTKEAGLETTIKTTALNADR